MADMGVSDWNFDSTTTRENSVSIMKTGQVKTAIYYD